MARPEKTGCQYFPLDCNFYNDRKVRLLRAEFGAKAEAVLIRRWCAIYQEAGWYARIDEDEIALMAESMGKGFTAGYIREVILGACRRGIFDEAVFAAHRVLTSEGVQKQYLAIKAKKKIIPVIREYWVLKESFFKGENEQLLLKLQFFSISAEKTAVNSGKTPVVTAQTQQKESKGKESESTSAAEDPRLDTGLAQVAQAYEANIGTLSGYARSIMQGWLQEHTPELVCAAIREAVEHNARTPAYVTAILRNWRDKGITSPAALAAERAAAQARKKPEQKEEKKRDLSQC